MKKILPALITAAVLLAGCSSTHTITQNINSKQTIAEKNAQVQRDFINNLLMLAKCNPEILDNYAYMYKFYNSGFSDLYFTGFNSLQFTPHKLYLSYDASYAVRNYAINEYVSQYADPYTPAPAGFQKVGATTNDKYPQPVQITRGYNYVQGGYIDRATTNSLGNTSQNDRGISDERRHVNSAASKYENVTQPQRSYTPSYAENNNNNNSYQANYNNQSAGTQSNNNNANSGTAKNAVPRD